MWPMAMLKQGVPYYGKKVWRKTRKRAEDRAGEASSPFEAGWPLSRPRKTWTQDRAGQAA
jgi:hypothetical protein